MLLKNDKTQGFDQNHPKMPFCSPWCLDSLIKAPAKITSYMNFRGHDAKIPCCHFYQRKNALAVSKSDLAPVCDSDPNDVSLELSRPSPKHPDNPWVGAKAWSGLWKSWHKQGWAFPGLATGLQYSKEYYTYCTVYSYICTVSIVKPVAHRPLIFAGQHQASFSQGDAA